MTYDSIAKLPFASLATLYTEDTRHGDIIVAVLSVSVNEDDKSVRTKLKTLSSQRDLLRFKVLCVFSLIRQTI